MRRNDLSEAIQDYLKELYKLEASGRRSTTSAIAKSLGVAPSSATAMVKKLAALGLVEHAPYRGATLTEAGRNIGLEVTRHHRLLEVYLAETLGLGIDAVHDEADRLEHAISEELEARIDQALGFPTHDPHGDPIPDAALHLQPRELRSLAQLEPGDEATVRRIPDGDPRVLRFLAGLDLVPGCRVLVCRSGRRGSVTVAIDGREHSLPREVAGLIGVG